MIIDYFKIFTVVSLLIVGALIINYYVENYPAKNNHIEMENKRLTKSVDSLMQENKKLLVANSKIEDSIATIKKERLKDVAQVRYIRYSLPNELQDVSDEIMVTKIEETFEESEWYNKDSSYFKTTAKEIDGLRKTYPIFLIDKMVAIDYLVKDKYVTVYSRMIEAFTKENELLGREKINFLASLENYEVAMHSQKKIIDNTTLLFNDEKHKHKLYEAIAYGAISSTVLLSAKQKPSIVLPVGLIIGVGKYFLFN